MKMYRLSYFDVLKAWVYPHIDLRQLIIFIVIPLVIMVVIAYCRKESFTARHYVGGVSLLLGIPLIIILTISCSFIKSGWTQNDDTLALKAFPVSTSLNIKQCKVLLITTNDSSWQPVRRTEGLSLPGLSMGWFKVRNGKKIILFQHLTSSSMLLLEFDDNYYLIRHPGVEELYSELLSKGAQKISDFQE